MNTLGTLLKMTSYGESHGESIGCVLDGFPAGFEVNLELIQEQMNRRRPGQSTLTTARNEKDNLQINSGLFEGKTTGAPIHMFILNTDSRPADYDPLQSVYRPSHADYTYEMRYGIRDYRGGGRSSARITAAWVAGGALAQHYLKACLGVEISAFVSAVGSITTDLSGHFSRNEVDANPMRCPDAEAAKQMEVAVAKAKSEGDSLGGQIQLNVQGLPAGIGNPVFDKLSAKLGHAMLSINAVKGFEIGGGFRMSTKRGSEVNDAFHMGENRVEAKSNHSGGIQGGISNGMDLDFRIAFKPTASIAKPQDSVNTQGDEVQLKALGRHDPCVVPRAVPIVESLAALVILDAFLSSQ